MSAERKIVWVKVRRVQEVLVPVSLFPDEAPSRAITQLQAELGYDKGDKRDTNLRFESRHNPTTTYEFGIE